MKRKKDRQFHFKQFSVRHDRSGMKVGTDGVLLGAWVNIKNATNILDIGAGTGLIALMAAQRTTPTVTIAAVELEEEAYLDAHENFITSPWKEKLTLHHGPIQNFQPPSRFDVIISNPPYFQNSYKPPTEKRIIARHTHTLSFDDLLKASHQLLSENGRLNVILPFTEGLEFIELAKSQGFQCSRKWSFRSRSHKPIERWLMEFTESATPVSTEEGEISLYNTGDEWSEAYQNLTREFYLKL